MKKVFNVFMLLFIVAFCHASVSAQALRPFPTGLPTCLEDDFRELEKIYNSTGGDNWTNKTGWFTNPIMENWYGIDLISGGCDVGSINMSTNNLVGNLANFSLPNLTRLILSGNQLTSVPNFNLPNLVTLYLYANHQLTNVPNFNLPNLQTLYLFDNNMISVPNFNLPNLQNLQLYSNKIISVPNFNLPNLTQLGLQDNQLMNVPNFNLPRLLVLFLDRNKLSVIPNMTLNTNFHYSTSDYNNLNFNIQNWNYFNRLGSYSPQNTILPLTINSGILTADLAGANNIADLTYTWYKDGVQIGSAIVGDNHYTPTQSGSYSYKVTHATVTLPPSQVNRNLILSSASVVFSACTPPIANITSNNGLALTCATPTTTLTATGGGTYLWSTGATTPSINVTTAGTFTVTITSANGCKATKSVTTTLNNTPPIVNITSNNGLALTCAIPTTTLAATGGGTYLWSTGATTASINVLTAGTFTVTVTGANGCKATKSVTTTLNNTLPIAAITGNKCISSPTTTLTATPGAGHTYLWNYGTPARTTQSITVPTGTYCVTVTNTATGCKGTACITVCQNPTVAISPVGNVNICSGQSFPLTAMAGNTATYKWSNNATTRTITVSPTANTSYSVTVTNAAGCTDIKSVHVNVLNCNNSSGCDAPNNIIGSNNGESAKLIQSKPLGDTKMIVFPNPSDNMVTVSFNEEALNTEGVSSQLELYNLQGQLLKQQPLEAGFDETKVSMQQLPAGVYMMSLRQNGQIISSVKVTKN